VACPLDAGESLVVTVALDLLARGFARSHDRLKQAMDEQDADATFFGLFETLNWLDSLLGRKDAHFPDGDDRIDGLRFVRGRVHHQWLDAVEFRKDVVNSRRIRSRDRSGGLVQYIDPAVIADWCWVPTSSLRGTGGRDRERRDAYDRALAGQPARLALRTFRDSVELLSRN
jgi:hypothetical protein